MKRSLAGIALLVLSLAVVAAAAPADAQSPSTSPPQVVRPATAPTAPQAPPPQISQPHTVPSQAAPSPPLPLQAAPAPAPSTPQPAAAATDDAGRPINAAAGRMPHDLSPWSMFLAADVLVKGVMIGLAFASLVTWTIFFAKSLQIAHARRSLRKALGRLAQTRSLSEAQLAASARNPVVAALLNAALQELKLSGESASPDGVKERAASRFSEISKAEARTMRQGMAIVATIAATSPFVGLFGTVWGIMNSFIGISRAQTTNLAVVAPGIAEALLATAIGLAAAIPAVIIYNLFARSTKGYLEFVGRAAGAVGRMLSRDLERGHTLARAAE